jgi:glycosyltransferase involved in cell wall biosynthesis
LTDPEKIYSSLISVLLSVYNSEKYLSSAIESILSQSYKNFEFIIIDDASTDSSWNIIKKYAINDSRIIAIKNKVNLGGCNTLNKGLKLCNGKYIARLDNDDWAYPDRLQKQFDFMEKHHDVGILGGGMEIINEGGNVIGKRLYRFTDSEIRRNIFLSSPFAHPLVMIRKSVIDLVGPYNSAYAPADDYELYFRIGKISKFANLDDILLQYRVVPNSMTYRFTKKMELATIKVRNLYINDVVYNKLFFYKLYNYCHYISIYIIPSKLKIVIFNFFRNKR